MYLNFKTMIKDSLGTEFIAPDNMFLSEIRESIYKSIDIDLCPDCIVIDGEGLVSVNFDFFYDSWANVPLKYFDRTLYEAGKNPFLDYDFLNGEACLNSHRRKYINEAIKQNMPLETQIKILRTAIMEICTTLKITIPAPIVSMTQTIEAIKSRTYPKSQETFDFIKTGLIVEETKNDGTSQENV